MGSPNIYLDWNATTPPHPSVVAAMAEALPVAWANPSSVHRHGSAARRHLERARAAVAELAGCDVREITFTAGGTEANNAALLSAVRGGMRVIYTSLLEHPSVIQCARSLAAEGRARLILVAVLPSGTIDCADLDTQLRAHGPGLVSVQALNQETGILQPMAEVLRLARAHGAHVHCDTVQAFGRSADTWLEADYRVIAMHKLRGPKGVGALVTRPGVPQAALLVGGAQEQGLRAGTVDGVAAAGVAAAAARAHAGFVRYAKLAPLRDRLEAAVLEVARGRGQVVGTGPRAPHVSCISFADVRAPELVAALDLEGLSVSAGSACSAGTVERSPVVTAMLGPQVAGGAMRLSLGEETTPDEVEVALTIVERVLPRFLR